MELEKMLTEMPTLTFDTVNDVRTKEEVVIATPVEVPKEVNLTPEEQKMVDEFAQKINLNDTKLVMQYGSTSQKKMADFSETALSSVRTKDMGEIGELLTDVVTELKEFNEPARGFLGFFRRNSNKLAMIKTKYAKAEENISKICAVMESHREELIEDAAMLDKMYDLNLLYFKELSMYILAGKTKLEQARTVELPELLKKAEQSGLPEDTQRAKDFAEMCNRFEKKIYDLELSRTVSLQMASQIRLIQNNDTIMSDKIQSTLMNTIPLWKSQMVIAIGVDHANEAAAAQRQVSDMTNALLKKNAEQLKLATIETAKEAERGIVDIETLQATNQTLISTLDEVMKIQEDGRKKRVAAEAELQKIEADMRQKLIEMSKPAV